MGKLKTLIKKGTDVYASFTSLNDYGETTAASEC